jgi:hypothetical protein
VFFPAGFPDTSVFLREEIAMRRTLSIWIATGLLAAMSPTAIAWASDQNADGCPNVGAAMEVTSFFHSAVFLDNRVSAAGSDQWRTVTDSGRGNVAADGQVATRNLDQADTVTKSVGQNVSADTPAVASRSEQPDTVTAGARTTPPDVSPDGPAFQGGALFHSIEKRSP